VAQRLARRICSSCETKYYPDDAVLEAAGLADKRSRAFRKGAGCQHCHNSGFQGRVGIYEVMEITAEIQRLIHREASAQQLRDVFRRHGGVTLREAGVTLALEGKTSLEEALRVTHTELDPTSAPSTDQPALSSEHAPLEAKEAA